ncbi:MAG: CotH kinase family protein, partial [Phycisphaerae bacterium]|nr:CotH kinase family protein [Phycisphaerae bacterium]
TVAVVVRPTNDSVATVTLYYRKMFGRDTMLPMNDNGISGDSVAGDGIYSATIPGQGSNDLVAFYVEGTDSHGISPMTTRFPTASDGEAHVMFGQSGWGGTFGTYRFWMTEADRVEWANRQKLSDEPIHGTFVYGDFRAIYNAGGRFRGSPFIRSNGDPESKDTSYVFYVPKDSRVIGSTSFNLDRLEGDSTKQRERMSLWLADQIDTPFFNMRYVHLFVNQNGKNTIYSDSHSPNDDFVNAYWSDGTDGELFKIDDWFEFNDSSQVSREFNDNAQLRLYTTTGGEKKQARYRWSWRKEPMGGFNDDYSLFYELVDAMNYDYQSPQFAATVPAIVDYDEWMRVFAIQHIINNWDSYGFNRGKNMSMYMPDDGQWQMIMWDLDHSHMTGSVDNNNLFSINDPILKNEFFNYPLFRRAYWRAIYDTAQAMDASKIDPVMDENYWTFQANGINPESPDSNIKAWVSGRRNWLLQQVTAIDSSFEITTNGGADYSTPSQIVTIQGTAPVAVKTMFLNGVETEVDFTSITGWNILLGLSEGDNVLLFEGYDYQGNLVASDTITVTFTNTAVSPVGQIVINEIMYNPAAAVEQGEFIEIYNASATTAFDLSGWRMDGVDLTFAPGSIITAGEYVVITENTANFVSTYGLTPTILGEYGGSLSNGGERLRLQMPDGGGGWTTIALATYGDALPWHVTADGTGPSLQLIDPTRDNGWIGNWAADSSTHYTPGAINSVYEILADLPQVRINEILSGNVTGLTDNVGDNDPWLELYNTGVSNVVTVEVHQADPDGGDVTMELELNISQPAGSETVDLVLPSQALWKYLDDGSDQGVAWRELAYDDSAWAEPSPGRFGYGDPVTTTLDYGPNASDKYITYYFRHEFEVADASLFESLDLLVQRDDGIIVYLNNNEVMRDHMPSGAVDYETLSEGGAIGGADETAWIAPTSPVNPAFLVNGTNIITVEMHQASSSSSDLGFDLNLTGERPIVSSSTDIIPLDAEWTY